MAVEKDEKDLQKILQLVLPSLNKSLKDALSEVFAMWKYFISFQDLSRMILLKLEEKMRLPTEAKEKLRKELERIYREEVATLPVNILRIPQRAPDEYPNFIRPDTQTIRYAEKLHDFYLGKFFQGDQEIRRRALNWMSKYYLEKGNPIGRGQQGVKDFIDEFREYIRPQTEWKARQIIDTSVNYLRNSARLRAFQRARIKYYRWDATNDRLTCSACRSLDGRLFRTEDAVRILDTIEASEDPTIIRELRPIITEPWKGKTADLLTKWPPLHPRCRCRIVAEEEEVTIPVTVERPSFAKYTPEQMELEKFWGSLSRKEVENRIRAHLGSSWERPVKGEKGVRAWERAKQQADEHWKKHGREFGYTSKEAYFQGAYDVIKNPERVYVESRRGKTNLLFIKGNQVVVSNDDELKIVSYYKLRKEAERDVEAALKGGKRDGLIRIL